MHVRVTLYPQALLVLNDEVLLAVLKLAQLVLRVLSHHTQLLKRLVDLLVLLRCAVHHPTPARVHLTRQRKSNTGPDQPRGFTQKATCSEELRMI